jgi:hypothetical protein
VGTASFSSAELSAQAIADSVTSAVGSNTFVFFAGFDGTDNAYVPVNGDKQNTAIPQLADQVILNGNTFSRSYDGVGTPGTLAGSDWFPTAVSLQSAATAQQAYSDFAQQAYKWLQSHPGGNVTSMITGFSRGCAAAAIFSQMLYENGLVYANPITKQQTMLIPPATVGAVSAALMLDPVLTGEGGNMDFPPGVQNLTVVRAENEYRSQFTAADYGTDNDAIVNAPGNHSDIGDAYDEGLGGVYLQAYTNFFQNAGLSMLPVLSTRQYQSGSTLAIHSESLTGTAAVREPWEATYNPTNDLTDPRETNSYGSPATVSGSAVSFTAYNGDLVLSGTGGSYDDTSSTVVLLPGAQASVTGSDETFHVAAGAALTYNSGSTDEEHPDNIFLGNTASLILNGSNANIFGSNTSITLGTGDSDVSIAGSNNNIILHEGSALANDFGEDNNITYTAETEGELTLDAGTIPAVSSYTDSGIQSFTLDEPFIDTATRTLSAGSSLGTLSFNSSTGVDSFKLADSLSITLPGITGDMDVAAPASGTSALATLVDYLGDLGDSTTASALDALNLTYWESLITGAPLGSGTVLDIATSNGEVTQDQWNALTLIKTSNNSIFSGNITAVSAGKFDLATAPIASNIQIIGLTAADWGGTTLIGNNTNGQTLTASLMGNDTLIAGSGTDDWLYAGAGVDTLIGGAGGGVFWTPDGLAAGSTIEGESIYTGTGSPLNQLVASGDLTGDKISDVQSLITSTVTLTADELKGFVAVGASGTGTINAATAGTYSLAGKAFTTFNMNALSNGGTTLTGNDASAETLTASATGNDTLNAGNGAGDVLVAGAGNDILTAGNGAGDVLKAGAGVDTLTGGTGGDHFIALNGLAAGSVVTGGSADSLQASGDISGASISTGMGTLAVSGSLTLTSAQLAGFTAVTGGAGDEVLAATGGTYDLSSKGSGFLDMTALSNDGTTLSSDSTGGETLTASETGNDTLIANGAGDTLIAGAGVDTMSGAGATFVAEQGLAAGSVVTGSGGAGNVLEASGDITDAMITGVQVLDLVGNVTLTSDQFAQFATIEGSGTYALAGPATTAVAAAAQAGMTGLSPIYVVDSGANVSANLDALQTLASGSELASITFTDAAPVVALSVAQLSSDAGAIALMAGTFGLAVSGVSVANAATVAAETGVSSVAVSDTSANVLASLGSLETLAVAGQLSAIAFTDTGTPALAFDAADAAANIDALAVLTGPFTLSVTDSAANVTANIDALGELAALGDLTSITLTDSGTPVLTLSATQVGDDAAALAVITGSYQVAVSDLGANVAANLDALQALATAGTLAGITLTDTTAPTLSLTETQLTSDAGALADISGTYTLAVAGALAADAATLAGETGVTSVSVTDTAANVSANLDALQALAAGGQLASVAFTDTGEPTLSLTQAQLASDAGAIAAIAGSYALAVSGVTAANAATVAGEAGISSVAITDTAANVSANLDALEALAETGELTSVTLSDSGTPSLSVTQVQLVNDTNALAAITGSYGLAVTGVAAITATTIAAEPNVASVSISDIFANVVTNIASLETLAVGGKLASVAFLDPGTPTLTLTNTQFTGNSAVLAAIAGSYNLAITAVLAANAASVAAQTHVASVAVSDTAANVISSLDALQTVATGGQLAAIGLTDGGTPTLALTATQFANDAGALTAITSAHNLTVSSVLAANATSTGATAHVTSLSVSDTGANVAANIAALQALGTKLSGVALTDGTTPTLAITASQLSGDATALGKITSAYNLAVSAVTAANAASTAGQAHVASVSVSDTAAHVVTSIIALETLATAGTLSAITLTDSGTPALALTQAQLTGDAAAIALITSPYTVTVTGVLAASAATIAAETGVTSVSVSDTAANVIANLDALQTLSADSQLAAIILTNGGTPTLSVTATQLSDDAGALAAITSSYDLSVSGVLAANASSVSGQAHVTALTVSDTSANVVAAIAALQAIGTQLTSVALTDGGTPVLSITGAQFTADSGAIGKITSAYDLSVSSVLAANVSTVGGNSHVTAIAVVDTGANVATNLNALETQNAKVTSTTLSDGTTPTLAITATQLSSDASALGKISSNYNLAVSAVTAANAAGTAAQAHVTSIAVSDTAANLATNLNSLQTIAAASELTSITVTNNTVAVAITLTQWTNDATAIGLFTGTYNFSVSGVSVLSQASMLATAHVASVSISDTAANVNAALDTLQGLGTKLIAIVLTDGGTPVLLITGTQFTSDATAIGKITSAYDLSVSSVLTANVSTVGGNSHVTAIAVVDTGANVATNLNALQTQNAKITSTTLTDGTTPTLAITATQLSSDASALGKISSNYNLAVSAVTAANAVSTSSQAHVVTIAVSDTAANLGGSNFDTLEGLAASAKLTGVTVTNNTVAVAITLTQWTNDTALLGVFTGTYSFSVSGVSVAGETSVLAEPHIASVSISDLAANVNAALDTLQGLGTKLVAIVLTDGGTPVLSITGAQFTADSGAIGKISGSYSLSVSSVLAANVSTVGANTHVTAIAVVDTGANVATNLNALQTQNAKVTSTVLTDGSTPTLAITATQLSSDASALGKIASAYNLAVSAVTAANAVSTSSQAHVVSIAVSDTAANVGGSNFDTLQGLAASGNLTGVTVTNNTVAVSITLTQWTNDTALLGVFTGTYNFSVSGVSVLSQASMLATAHVASVSISDTAANVNAALDTLQGLGTKLVAIVLTDGGTPVLSITGTQFTSDATAIGKISSAYSLSVSSVLAANVSTVGANTHVTAIAVVDTGANVAANLNALQTQNAKVTSTTLTDGTTPTLAITATQLSSDASALGKVVSAYNLAVSAVTGANATSTAAQAHVTSIAVSDTAANIATNINALQTVAAAGELTSVTVTNNTTPVSITLTQWTNDATAIGLFTGTYSFSVSGVSVANEASMLATAHVASVSLSDTAANVNAAIDTLQGLGTKLVAIVLTDGGTPVLSITGAQFTADSGAIAKISSAYDLSVSSVLAANVTTVGGNSHVTAIAVVDSGANVVTNLSALQTQNAKVTSTTLTDGTTPTLAITATQLSSDASALGKIVSAYNLAVSAVTAANATSTAAQAHVTSIAVSDTAANLSSKLDALQAVAAAGELTSVTVTNNTVPVSVTIAQLASDATALGAFTGTYSFTVTGVTVANEAATLALAHVASVSLSDTAANVDAALDTLQGLGTKLVAIALTDGGTPVLSITGTQFTADSATIAKISSAYSLSVSSVLAANVSTVGGNTHVTAIAVVDTGANVATNLNALETQNAKVTSTTLTDGTTPTLSITATQLSSDASALGKISSNYNLAVSAVTAANVTSVGSNAHVTSILVTDSVANVTTNLAALETSATSGKLTGVALTDSAPVLSVTGAQSISDSAAIAKITSAYKETVTADVNTTETLSGTGTLDTLSFSSATQGINANLATGSATTANSSNTYTLSGFENLVGSSSSDTLTGGSSSGYLTGNGGVDSYVLSTTGINAAKDTAAHLNGCTIGNFSVLDGIDLTTVAFGAHTTLGFSEDASNTFGTLTVSDGTHTAAMLLLGQYTAAGFQDVSDGGAGTMVAMEATTSLTAILAAAHG